MIHLPLRAFALLFVPLLSAADAAPSASLRILRIGDSITRYAATDSTLTRGLEAAGLAHEMVGSQESAPGNAASRMEGYNGKTIQFFTAPQKEFGQPPAVHADAVPLDLAFSRYSPDLVLLMVGTNNLGGPEGPEINAKDLRRHLDTLLDRIHELAPAAHLIVATATPADKNYAKWPRMAHRNERTAAYNEQVVKPAVAERAAAGRSIALADAFTALDPATDLSDGVHPNATGKAKINQVWLDAILAWHATRSPASAEGLQ